MIQCSNMWDIQRLPTIIIRKTDRLTLNDQSVWFCLLGSGPKHPDCHSCKHVFHKYLFNLFLQVKTWLIDGSFQTKLYVAWSFREIFSCSTIEIIFGPDYFRKLSRAFLAMFTFIIRWCIKLFGFGTRKTA